jgi:hypothetical protein
MKERDYIEDIINNNLERLNDDEPLPGHFKRFEAKLQKSNAGKERRTFRIIWRLAAAAVFAFLLVNQAIIWFSSSDKNMNISSGTEKITLASVSDEYKEVEFHYINSIDNGLEQWNKLVSEGFVSEEEQMMMKTELAEFETVYNKLQKDLRISLNDDRVINAMLEYYQTKLSLINMIVNKLKEVKQKNNIDHEKEI